MGKRKVRHSPFLLMTLTFFFSSANPEKNFQQAICWFSQLAPDWQQSVKTFLEKWLRKYVSVLRHGNLKVYQVWYRVKPTEAPADIRQSIFENLPVRGFKRKFLPSVQTGVCVEGNYHQQERFRSITQDMLPRGVRLFSQPMAWPQCVQLHCEHIWESPGDPEDTAEVPEDFEELEDSHVEVSNSAEDPQNDDGQDREPAKRRPWSEWSDEASGEEVT